MTRIVPTGIYVPNDPTTAQLLATGQTTQYSSELDDGYYQKGLSKLYQILTTGSQSGTTNIDLTHLVSDSGAFLLATQTYTDVAKCGVFLATGGETIIISGSASNNGTFTSASATANTLVVTAGFVNEADAPETTFKKREAHSNAIVVDLRSDPRFGRRMWSQTASGSMGTAGDGKMPWTGVAYDIFAYCAAANTALLGGYGDWRTANIKELFGLLIWEVPVVIVNAVAFPGFPSTEIWTSTTSPAAITQAPGITTVSANVVDGTNKTVSRYVILVRGG